MHTFVLSALLLAWQGGSMTPTGKGVYPIVVDYDVSFWERLKASGANFPDPGITPEHFATKGTGKASLNAVMIQFDSHVTSTKEVLAIMHQRKLRPATADELCEFLRRYTAFAHEFPIVALGSVWKPEDDGIGRVIIAEPHLGGLKVDIEYFDSEDWTMNVRFLAVPLGNKNTSRK